MARARSTTSRGWERRIRTSPRTDGVYVDRWLQMKRAAVCRRDKILQKEDI